MADETQEITTSTVFSQYFLDKLANVTLQEKMSVYVRDDPTEKYLKETLHFRDNVRIAPVIVTPKQEGVVFVKDVETKNNLTTIGYHGYDPFKFPSMRPFFLAMGPAFKANHTVTSIECVDIYPLMCHILGLTPAPNNGSIEHVKGLLRMDVLAEKKSDVHQPTGFTTTWVSYLVLIGLCGILALLYGIYMFLFGRQTVDTTSSMIQLTQRKERHAV